MLRRLWCRILGHEWDYWIVVDNGGGTRLLQCRDCGCYHREQYPVYTDSDGIVRERY